MGGVTVREVAGPAVGTAANQSMVHAVFAVGARSTEHLHRTSEEVLWIVAGRADVRVDGERHDVRAGSCIVVAPGARHKLFNTGDVPLELVACCAPAFSVDDTVTTE